MDNVAAIILAAGKASRFRAADPEAATKVVALYKGEPMVRHAAQAAVTSGAAPVIVVTGCEPDAVRGALDGLDVHYAHNANYESGIASSIVAGIAALPETAEAAFIMLGDMPLVDAALLQALVDARRESPQAAAIVPVHDGQRGNPVLLSRSLFTAAKELKGDEGARRLLRDPAIKVIEVETGPQASVDIDTPDALQSLDTRAAAMDFTIQYDEQVLRQAVATFVHRRVMRGMGASGLFALVFTFAALVYLNLQGDYSWVSWLLGAVLTLFVLVVIMAWRWRLADVLRKLAAIPSRQAKVLLSAEGIVVSVESGASDLSWSSFTEVWKLPDVWLLFLAPNNFITLPTKDVPPQALDFISAHLPVACKQE